MDRPAHGPRHVRWYGTTRFSGPRLARQFFLAPAGEHHAIATRLLPGARVTRQTLRGHDAVLVEAADRSDSALVLAGPYHEAATWFGGPAPDAPRGEPARGVPVHRLGARRVAGPCLLRWSGSRTSRSSGAVRARSSSCGPPWTCSRRCPSGPACAAWRGAVADRAKGVGAARGRHRPPVRYLFAGDTAAMDLVLLGPESGRPALPLGETQVVDALTGLLGRWGI